MSENKAVRCHPGPKADHVEEDFMQNSILHPGRAIQADARDSHRPDRFVPLEGRS